MTPEAIEALALRRAAEVARNVRGTHDECHDTALFTARDIATAILALAPVSPLQAALEVPEVKALVEALVSAKSGLSWARVHLDAAGSVISATVLLAENDVDAALAAALEGRT